MPFFSLRRRYMRILRDDWGFECRDEIDIYFYKLVYRDLENGHQLPCFLVLFYSSHSLPQKSLLQRRNGHIRTCHHWTTIPSYRTLKLHAQIALEALEGGHTRPISHIARQIFDFILQIFLD